MQAPPEVRCLHRHGVSGVAACRPPGSRHLTRLPAQAEAAAPPQEPAPQPAVPEPASKQPAGRKLVLPIYRPRHELCWPRWELRMLQLLEEQEAAAAARGETAQDSEEEEAEGQESGSDGWADYFGQYNNPGVHLPTLLDTAYVSAWAQAIEQLGPTHIKDKVVVDVGCGPGLLSVLCAKAGAKKVIAIDGSKAMANAAKQVAEANGLSSVIEVVQGRVQDMRLRERADVLVSSWPGPGLLGGGMLPTVAAARHHLLKPGGLVLPSTASLHVTGIEDRAALAGLKQAWSDVAGCDLSAAMGQVVLTPRITTLQRTSQLCTSTAALTTLELGTITRSAARAGIPPTPFQLTCLREERLFGLILHFDLGFGAVSQPLSETSAAGQEGETTAVPAGDVTFTTHPRSPSTSFQQLVLNFPRSIKVNKGDVVEGTLSMQPAGSQGRDLLMDLQISYAGVQAGVQYTLAHAVPLTAHVAALAQAAEAAL